MMDGHVAAVRPRALLTLRGIRKNLGGNTVADGIDLILNSGECVVLLGPSGCGKTSTLRMIAGFIDPDAGEIEIDGELVVGKDVRLATERRRLGMVFQSYAIWPHKTVFENVAFALQVAGLHRTIIKERVASALETVQLSQYAETYPSDLSGGQQQRVALARAIVHEPRLLLLDEPLSNLDASLRDDLRAELKRLHRLKKISMLYVTHDQEEALVLADKIAVMNAGRVEQFDTPEKIFRQPISRFVASVVGAANILEAQIIEKTDEKLRLQLDVDFTSWVQVPKHIAREHQVGAQIGLVVRPDDLIVSTNGPGMNATVTDVSFLGNSYEVALSVGERRFRARTKFRPEIDAGAVRLTFDPSTAWVVR